MQTLKYKLWMIFTNKNLKLINLKWSNRKFNMKNKMSNLRTLIKRLIISIKDIILRSMPKFQKRSIS
jgi:hypothetical protein